MLGVRPDHLAAEQSATVALRVDAQQAGVAAHDASPARSGEVDLADGRIRLGDRLPTSAHDRDFRVGISDREFDAPVGRGYPRQQGGIPPRDRAFRGRLVQDGTIRARIPGQGTQPEVASLADGTTADWAPGAMAGFHGRTR